MLMAWGPTLSDCQYASVLLSRRRSAPKPGFALDTSQNAVRATSSVAETGAALPRNDAANDDDEGDCSVDESGVPSASHENTEESPTPLALDENENDMPSASNTDTDALPLPSSSTSSLVSSALTLKLSLCHSISPSPFLPITHSITEESEMRNFGREKWKKKSDVSAKKKRKKGE